jgi:hypothetical protein
MRSQRTGVRSDHCPTSPSDLPSDVYSFQIRGCTTQRAWARGTWHLQKSNKKKLPKRKSIPPRVSQGRTARAQTAPQIQARRQAPKRAKLRARISCSNPLPLLPSTADFYGFFFHAIPEKRCTVLTLPELYALKARSVIEYAFHQGHRI